MFSDTIIYVKLAIENILATTFPSDYVNHITSGKITVDDLVLQILVESCKYAFENSLPKHSLRYYLQQSNLLEDDQRMLIHRTLKKINTYRTAEYSIIKKQSGIELDNLIPKRMDSISNKLSGYEFTPFQFWEIKNVRDMKLIDDIISGRISKKNFNHQMFQISATEYEEIIGDLLSQSQHSFDSDKIYAIISLFTIEWKYSFDFYYSVISEMESLNISSVPNLGRRCSLFCGLVSVQPSFSRLCYHVDSRMLHIRQKYIREFVSYSPDEFKSVELQYSEILALCSIISHKFNPWFIENTSLTDWISVLDEYCIGSCFLSDKKWSRKKIRYIKEIYKSIHTDIKNPDFRS